MTFSNSQNYFNQNMGSSYIEYEQQGQSQIIQNQTSQGPISLPSLAGSLKNYTSQSTVGQQQPIKEEPPVHQPQVVQKLQPNQSVRLDVSLREKDKEADKAKKKGMFKRYL